MTVDIFGWIAGALVLATFCLRTMIPLRSVAIASNIAFMAYGLMAGTLPIVVLHLALLPMNVLRLQEMRWLARRVRHASGGTPCVETLVPHMQLRRVPAGSTLFREGDCAKEVYLILEGRVLVAGKKARVDAGQLVGEMGIFAPGQRHPESAVCESEVSVAAIGEDKIWELFYRNPEFGAHLLRLITSRCLDGKAAGAPAPASRPASSGKRAESGVAALPLHPMRNPLERTFDRGGV